MPSSFSRRLLLLAGLAAALSLGAPPAYAVPGELDHLFGLDGLSGTNFGDSESANDVAIQADGKVVAVGRGRFAGEDVFALARYTHRGAHDETFGNGGTVLSDDFAESAHAVAIQKDGKIVVVGAAHIRNGDFELARYNADGSADTTFGISGFVETDFGGGRDVAFALAIQKDGKIVAAGSSSNPPTTSDFVLARYNHNGSLDDGSSKDSTPGDKFGVTGKVRTDFSGPSADKTNDGASDIAIQADGKIVAAGTAVGGQIGDPEFALARYQPNGSLDTSFGPGGGEGDGRLTTEIPPDAFAEAVAIQRDGKIVAAGAVALGPDNFALARYNLKDGSLDDGGSKDATPGDKFGPNGKVQTDFGGRIDQANDVAIQADGKIVAAGSSSSGPSLESSDFALARYDRHGAPDKTFDGDGKVRTNFFSGPSTDAANAVAIQAADGKIVAAGGTGPSALVDFALARYLP